MARATLTKTTPQAPNPTAGVAVTWADANTTDLNQFALTGRELLLARNTGTGAQTVTITSVEDPFKRTRHITTESIAAGAMHAYGPIGLTGWLQSDGFLYLQASSIDIEFAIIVI